MEGWLQENIIEAPGSRVHVHRFDRAYERWLTMWRAETRGRSHIGDLPKGGFINRLESLGHVVSAYKKNARDPECCPSIARYVHDINVREWDAKEWEFCISCIPLYIVTYTRKYDMPIRIMVLLVCISILLRICMLCIRHLHRVSIERCCFVVRSVWTVSWEMFMSIYMIYRIKLSVRLPMASLRLHFYGPQMCVRRYTWRSTWHTESGQR